MNLQALRELLKKHEGENVVNGRHLVYPCSAGKLTAGWGRNMQDKGLSNTEAQWLLENDISEVLGDLNKIFDEFFLMPEPVQQVLADMRFQLGPNGFRDFKKMIVAVKKKQWQNMITEMVDSDWYKQVKNRADELIEMIKRIG